ncbi:hypothetical protein Droror1_Dr00002098 [Drosera rotundifolia]
MIPHPCVRLISYTPELEDGKPFYVSSNSYPVKAQKFEPAGYSFHSAALRLSGFGEKGDSSSESDEQDVPNGQERSYMPSYESYSSKSKKKSGTEDNQQDHYALLGLAHLRYLATEEQIRRSYKDTCLKFHPDKQAAILLELETEEAKEAKKVEFDTHFKAIQEAYKVLSDPQSRRMYDSTDEFDDEIPTDCAPEDFYKVFGPAFMRNGRWSVTQPIPLLGDEKTPVKEVDKFYDFWYGFKSWREFPHADEFDLEQADSRDHKRWMERQNAKLTEKARKEEYNRVRTLVDNAYKRDPRILKRKEEEKAEKQRRKEAKYLMKKMKEKEAAKAAEEERIRKEEEDKKAAELALQQKKIKEKEKKFLRKERTHLRALAAPLVSNVSFNISENDVESLCMSLEFEKLKDLCDSIDGKEKAEQGKLLRAALGDQGNTEADKGAEEKTPQQNGCTNSNGNVQPSGYVKKEKPWEKEEIELLRKGMLKYPKGTSRRWEVISEYIGTGRSVEEILKATKTVLLQKPDSSKAFDSFLEKRKPAASIGSPLSTREEIEGVSGVNNSEAKAVDATPPSSTPSDHVPVGTSTANPTSSGSDQDIWSAVQERALIQALKTFPKEVAQRWERVAAAVPGKSVNQCKKKFTSLKANFRNMKSSS